MTTDIIPLRPHVFVVDNVPMTNTRHVAEYFGKQHGHVLRAVRDLSKTGLIPPHFFTEAPYIDDVGRTQSSYDMTRDGMMLLTMGFAGDKAIVHKVEFLAAFSYLEAKLLRYAPRVPALSGAYVKAMSGMMNKVFELCPNLSAPVRQSVAVQFCAKVGVNVPAPVIESKLYPASDIADEIGITVQKMARDDRYKTLKGLEGYGLHTLCTDASGTPRSTWQWSERGRRAVVRAFADEDELQELLS